MEEKLEKLIEDIRARLEKGEAASVDEVKNALAEAMRSYAQASTVGYEEIEKAVREAEERVRSEMERQAEEMLRSFALAQAVREVDDQVDKLVEEGRVPPASAETARALLVALLGVEGEARSYAADEIGEYGNQSLHTLFVDFLHSLPSKRAEPAPTPTQRPSTTGGAELYRSYLSGGVEVMKELAEKVEAIKKDNPGISHYEAYRRAISR